MNIDKKLKSSSRLHGYESLDIKVTLKYINQKLLEI